MRPKNHPMNLRKVGGFTLVSAIFIIVVLAGLGAAMVNISGSQHRSSAMDILGSRAYHAARTGIQWGVHRIVTTNACFTSPSSFVPPAGTLNTFTVQLTCASTVSNGVTVYEVTSTACNFPVSGSCPGDSSNVSYVERVLQVTL